MPLHAVSVDAPVRQLRPDFRVLALRVSGIRNGPSTPESDAWLAEAEAKARAAAPGVHRHIAAWQEAYRAFGAKPQRTPSSVEALWQRAVKGALPRVNWLVDLYNAVSVSHVLPVGGEDAARFAGDLRLVRATGHEPFDTVRESAAVVEHALPGEVVWADDLGVTCRRWNWRQGTRTRLTENSTDALFLLERLEPFPLSDLEAAGDALVRAISLRFPTAIIERQILPSPASGTGAP
ncbi:MAG: B3/4 domain-containing protein [Vicinamibacterales bacterium]